MEKYTDLYDSESSEQELQNRQYEAREFDCCSVEQIEHEFQQTAELFMEQNLVSSEHIAEFLNNFAMQIRSELKTK